jgi:hypothetical protein
MPFGLQRVLPCLLLASPFLAACGHDGTSPEPSLTPLPSIVYVPVETTTFGAHDALQEDLDSLEPDLNSIDWEGLAEITAAEEEAKRQTDIETARTLYGRCGEWHDLAISVGWTEEEWPTLSRIIYRESRCIPEACSKSDSGLKCRDAGLVQVNQIHREWLSSMGYNFPDDLFDPAINLTFARRLFETSGWKPWRWLSEP